MSDEKEEKRDERQAKKMKGLTLELRLLDEVSNPCCGCCAGPCPALVAVVAVAISISDVDVPVVKGWPSAARPSLADDDLDEADDDNGEGGAAALPPLLVT